MCVIGGPKGKEKSVWAENKLKGIIAGNFPSLAKDTNYPIGKADVKLALFADDMILYIERIPLKNHQN